LFQEVLRVEHFDNASRHGAVAANNMLGSATAFDHPYWFWSDQYSLNLQYAGHAREWDDLVVRGSIDDFDFCAFYISGGLLRAAFGVERGDEVAAARELIARRAAVDRRLLADPYTDLAALVEAGEEVDSS
jgi:3-phenylpropionate/trans-cinnamate dioxygenase ferredoxin reductase subunit